MRKTIWVAAAVGAAVSGLGGMAWAGQAPTPAPQQEVKLMDLRHTPQERPSDVAVTWHDGIQDLTWSQWGESRAVGRGTLVLNPCEPDCATAPRELYRDATITVDQVRHTADGEYYSRYTITAPDLPPEKAAQLRDLPAEVPGADEG